jgi:hypothetical protein
MVVKMSLVDDTGNVIKEEEFGNAYLEDIDMAQAAADWWHARYKRLPSTPRECFKLSKIVDILITQLKSYILNKFLCDRDAIYEEYKSEAP